jgi:hypothetical protein
LMNSHSTWPTALRRAAVAADGAAAPLLGAAAGELARRHSTSTCTGWAGKIISSLPRWLLITMMIMVILTRDLACCRRRPPMWRGHHRRLQRCFTSLGRDQLVRRRQAWRVSPGIPANDDQLDGPCVDDRPLPCAAVGNRGGAGSFLVRGVCGRSAQFAGVQTFLPSRQQLTELLDCRQLAGTDLTVLAVRGFGDPLSDGDEPFVHLGALIRRQ